MKVHDIEQVEGGYLSQFYATTEDHRPAFIDCRRGELTVEVGAPRDPREWLPGTGYDVLLQAIEQRENVAWEQIEPAIEALDLGAALAPLLATERDYVRRWASLFEGIRRRDIAGTSLWTLSFDEPMWAAIGANRVGQFDFERALLERAKTGVVAYVHAAHTAPHRALAVRLSDDAVGRFDSLSLVRIGAQAFGGVQFGVSSPGHAECLADGDPERAFVLIGEEIARAGR